MGASLGDARSQRQHKLRPIECLDLTLLVHAQHHGLQRRIHVQPDDVAHLIDEHRIAGELERLLPMQLQAEGSPDARNGGLLQPAFARRLVVCLRYTTDSPGQQWCDELLTQYASDACGHGQRTTNGRRQHWQHVLRKQLNQSRSSIHRKTGSHWRISRAAMYSGASKTL